MEADPIDTFKIVTQAYNLRLKQVVEFVRDPANREVVNQLVDLLQLLDGAALLVDQASRDLPNDKGVTVNGIKVTAGRNMPDINLGNLDRKYYEIPGLVKGIDLDVFRSAIKEGLIPQETEAAVVSTKRSKGSVKLPISKFSADLTALLGLS